MVTIFTPTYNRKSEIKKLYDSLLKQTNRDFEWIVIDDGSDDGTDLYFKQIMDNDLINIRYYKQSNSGKHIAFNKAIEKCRGDVFICVDSDDYLTPYALEKINQKHKQYGNIENICGYVFLKGDCRGKPVTKRFPKRESIEDYNEYIINEGIGGDKAEVFKSEILKKYRFPNFENEKFLSEGFMWSYIGRKYKYVFIDEIIYICNYLVGGLTKSGRKLRIENPKGGMEHAKEYIDKIYNIKIREKNALLYNTYCFFDRSNILQIQKKFNMSERLLLDINIIPSYILYLYWRKKYL